MAYSFAAAADPSAERVARIAALAPENPFYTKGFVAARRAAGAEPWALSLNEDGELVAACTAFMSTGRLSRMLEIQSLPSLPDGDAFWQGLLGLCCENGVTDLVVNSFGSKTAVIPPLAPERWRRRRVEYVLDLTRPNPWEGLSSNHKRNIRRAERAGVRIRRVTDPTACEAHARMISASLARRRSRGEEASEAAEAHRFAAFTESGAGELYQASLGGEVVSSVLVLTAAKGGYYHSAGTSPKGMAIGASQFLIRNIAESLRDEGRVSFNLGGAGEEHPGLARFKAGFGAEPVALEAALFFTASAIRHKVLNALRDLRRDPRKFVRDFLDRVEHYAVYAGAPGDIPPPPELPAVTIKKMCDEALLQAVREHPGTFAHYEKVWWNLGHNDAYAVHAHGKLVHVGWLIPADHDRLYPVRNVKLREGEIEITHCATLPEFRGRGFYQFAIRSLARLSASRGIRKVFMCASLENIGSQRGIERAGLTRVGRIIRVRVTYFGNLSIVFRGHRLKLR